MEKKQEHERGNKLHIDNKLYGKKIFSLVSPWGIRFLLKDFSSNLFKKNSNTLFIDEKLPVSPRIYSPFNSLRL